MTSFCPFSFKLYVTMCSQGAKLCAYMDNIQPYVKLDNYVSRVLMPSSSFFETQHEDKHCLALHVHFGFGELACFQGKRRV